MSKIFNHKLKVYYEDTDAGGVVYYANYLKFFERARTEALANIGLSNLKIKDDYKALIIVKSCSIDYKKSAFLEDELNIKSYIISITKTSFTMSQTIIKSKIVIAEAKVHLVFVNEKVKPIKIPKLIVDKFNLYIPNII